MSRLDDIAAFVSVAETGSISNAARKLKISPSVVSRRLAALEFSLKTDLILRSTRKIGITEKGKSFYEECKSALDAISRAQERLENSVDRLQGALHVHSTLGMGHKFLSVAVAEFLKVYPDVTVDLTVDAGEHDLIGENCDVVIKNTKPWLIPEGQCIPIARIRYLVCASPEYLVTHGHPRSPHELSEHNCLLHLVDKPVRDWRFREGSEEIRISVNGSLVTNNGTGLYDAAKRGLGIVRMPDFAILDDITSGDLVVLFDNVVGMDRALAAQVARHNHHQPRIEAFINFVRDYVGRQLQRWE